MSTQHTKGPWSAFIGKNGTIAIDIGAKPSGTMPCIVNWTGFSDSDLSIAQCKANARLIAAAPDLLEALKAAVRTQAYKRGSGPEWWEHANNVITRAEGGAA